jgi:hypothetical protein
LSQPPLCHNPTGAVDEMLVQHLLTERLLLLVPKQEFGNEGVERISKQATNCSAYSGHMYDTVRRMAYLSALASLTSCPTSGKRERGCRPQVQLSEVGYVHRSLTGPPARVARSA